MHNFKDKNNPKLVILESKSNLKRKAKSFTSLSDYKNQHHTNLDMSIFSQKEENILNKIRNNHKNINGSKIDFNYNKIKLSPRNSPIDNNFKSG